MGRMYSVIFENVAVSAAQDFFEISPADDKPVIIHAVYLSQSTELGDAAEEFLRVEIIRGHTSGGSGGTAPTPVALDPAGAAAGFASEVNNTTIASAGTALILHAETFNVRTGWVYIPTPECRPKASQANTTIVVRLMAAPGDSVTMGGTIYIEEM
jgi:hypothetical protein